MSKLLKGFVEIQALQSTLPGVISPLGELSVWSMTFTKDVSVFGDPTIPGYRLVSTSCTDNVLGAVEPSAVSIAQVLSMVREAKSYVDAHPMPCDITDLHATLAAAFYNDVGLLKLGPMMSTGTIQLPEWLEWTSLAEPDVRVKIWLSDTAFANQYDLYDITVIPPLAYLDDFFKTPVQVAAALDALSASQMMDTIQEAKSRNPETYIRTITFKYVSPILNDAPLLWNWTVLIYGVQGDNVDAIKDAIVAHVLANSVHPQSDWELIFPDLFKRTEFIVLPRWDKIAIPDMAVQSGLYTSVVTPYEVIDYVTAKIDFYPPTWAKARHAEILPFPYKCLTLIALAGPTNDVAATTLAALFPDYLPITASELDFNRMDVITQEWIVRMEQLLRVAEHLETYTTIPDPVRLVKRNGQTFVSAFYNNVNFLVEPKASIG